jgi:hypothetical protein
MPSDFLTPIQKEAILRERITKENSNLQYRTEFSTNALSLQRNFVSGKFYTKNKKEPTNHAWENSPRKNKPEKTAEELKLTQELKRQYKTDLKRFDLGPREKYKLPQTRAQELGWYWDEPGFADEVNDEVYNPSHSIKQCDVTLYAKAHIQSKGINPFLRRN